MPKVVLWEESIELDRETQDYLYNYAMTHPECRDHLIGWAASMLLEEQIMEFCCRKRKHKPERLEVKKWKETVKNLFKDHFTRVL